MGNFKRKLQRAQTGKSGPAVEQLAIMHVNRLIAAYKANTLELMKRVEGITDHQTAKARVNDYLPMLDRTNAQQHAIDELSDELDAAMRWLAESDEAAPLRDFKELIESGALYG
jgi:hypothetical protein